MADVTRPVKKHLSDFCRIEDKLQDAVLERFGVSLTDEEREMVRSVDDTMLYYEFLHYMGERLADNAPEKASEPIFCTVPFEEAERRYKEIFERYKIV